MTELVNWRNKHKDAYKKREGENLTFTPLFVWAVARAIQDFPAINVSVDGDYIIKKSDINIGVAVALPSGNLIVPVIHNADQLNLNGLSKRVNDLATRAFARNPNFDPTLWLLIAANAHLGRMEEARRAWAEMLKINPDFSLEQRARVLPYKDPGDFQRIVDGLTKAGLQ